MDDRERAALWYKVVEDTTLRQGDIFRNVLAFALPQSLPLLNGNPKPDDLLPVEAEWEVGDWILMSASCDLERGAAKYPHVLVCRIWPLTEDRLGAKTDKKLRQQQEVIRKGYDPMKFLLAEHPGDPNLPLSFAAFRPHLTLPLEYLRRACVGKRLRLLSPHREAFGNWVASNFSRVGVEDDVQVPRFIDGEPSAEARLAMARQDYESVPQIRRPEAIRVSSPHRSTASDNPTARWGRGVWRAAIALWHALVGR